MPTRTAPFDGFWPLIMYGFLSVPVALYCARMRMKRISRNGDSCRTQRAGSRRGAASGKPSQWPLVLQLRHVRVAVGVVDELVVGEVLQAVVVDAAEQREHAEQVGREVVQVAVAEQDVVRAFVRQPAELVLPRADEDDRRAARPARSATTTAPSASRFSKNQTAPPMTSGEVQVRADEVPPVREVVRPPQVLQRGLELGVGRAISALRSWWPWCAVPPSWRLEVRRSRRRTASSPCGRSASS